MHETECKMAASRRLSFSKMNTRPEVQSSLQDMAPRHHVLVAMPHGRAPDICRARSTMMPCSAAIASIALSALSEDSTRLPGCTPTAAKDFRCIVLVRVNRNALLVAG